MTRLRWIWEQIKDAWAETRARWSDYKEDDQ